MSAPDWSEWQQLAGWSPSPTTLAETLDGGQSFRWYGADGIWSGRWANCLVQLRLQESRLEWRTPASQVELMTVALPQYLGSQLDWPGLADALPWRSDPHLARCIRAFPDLRILRQPFGEALLGFLCSATKQIVQIKQMVALLAERHGRVWVERVALNAQPERVEGNTFHRLPTWYELAQIPEKDLRACLLGFRAKYIHATAQYIAGRPGWLEETEHLPYADAKARLLELPGVGEKVADCVLLFGAGQLEAFPVDTWILKALERRYGLHGWKPAQIAHFGRTHFGPRAGLAQQYLFSWERGYGGR
jgi:N-glycosylase/DNA lyase